MSMKKILDFAAAERRLDELAKGLPATVAGVLELGRRVAQEPNAEELCGVLVILGSASKLEALAGGDTPRGMGD